MKKLGVIGRDVPLSPRHAKVPPWPKEPNKAWQQRRMEVYAARIDSMDARIGRIVRALADAGRLDNTLIMFTVDNGGCHVEYGASRKGSFLNAQTRDGRPLKGGIRVPLIVQWPGVIAKGGQITDQPAHVIDLMPTALAAAGAEYPKTFQGRAVAPADGKSLLPIFRGERRQPHGVLYWRFAHGRAVRRGKWKLVQMDRKPWELYDVVADPVELNDLAKKHADKAQQLQTLWDAWSRQGRPKKRKKTRK